MSYPPSPLKSIESTWLMLKTPMRKRKLSLSFLYEKVSKLTSTIESKSGVQPYPHALELGHNALVAPYMSFQTVCFKQITAQATRKIKLVLVSVMKVLCSDYTLVCVLL